MPWEDEMASDPQFGAYSNQADPHTFQVDEPVREQHVANMPHWLPGRFGSHAGAGRYRRILA